MKKNIVIAGPCAAESEQQIQACFDAVAARAGSVDFLRISLRKPRTKPGWDGLGLEQGVPLFQEALRQGICPATEVMAVAEAEKILAAVLPEASPTARILLWVGSRNQNHDSIQRVSRLAAQDSRVYVMVKNQPWPSKDHWLGIADHLSEGGCPAERLLLCHRGFAPYPGTPNPEQWRNFPDFRTAMEVREKTGLAMVFDPSHTAGKRNKIASSIELASHYDFDGYIVEVHPDPENAWTDRDQQISWSEFDQLPF